MDHPSATDDPGERVRALVAHLAHLLPAQGPISVFVHHNTLHAFEDRPFDDAVPEAAALFSCEPWLGEAELRRALAAGRIRDEDLAAVLAEEGGADEALSGGTTRRGVQLLVLRHGIPRARGAELAWTLSETDTLERLRADTPAPARIALHGDPPRSEGETVSALWTACVAAADALPPAPVAPASPPARHRDLLLAAAGADSDDLVHPVLIRLSAAWLDQGTAYWPMPERESGFWQAVRSLYAASRPPGPWLTAAAAELASCDESPEASVLRSLEELGVPEPEHHGFLSETLLALRGFGGMFHQLEERPDRAPVRPLPARVVDLLAVRLVLERHALSWLAREAIGWRGPLAELRGHLRGKQPLAAAPTPREHAYLLFQIAQLAGLPPAAVAALPPAGARALLEAADIRPHEVRRLLHLAYERRHGRAVLGALAAHVAAPPSPPPAPNFQVVLCIDDREESLRRHLEEIAPGCETAGSAGFFGVAMYFRGAADARPRPLCPIAIRPSAEVAEEVDHTLVGQSTRRARARRAFAQAGMSLRVGSRTLARGTLLTATLGLLAAIPLVLRVLFPRLATSLGVRAARLLRPPARTHLAVKADPDVTPLLGTHTGFTVEEQATIVRSLLEETGLGGWTIAPGAHPTDSAAPPGVEPPHTTDGPADPADEPAQNRLARLVLIVGHGSSSINNPHLSAYACGACGGSGGGPNARAFAHMANDSRVRTILASQDRKIPYDTIFVGLCHDTAQDSVEVFDRDRVPPTHAAELDRALAALDLARARNAHERCRRFEAVPAWLPPALALAHVEGRVSDLAQPRPEYGHSTNAVAIIGRRDRTRGLFLDRRAFLVSYDPTRDDQDRTVLARILGAVVPVGVGINLEYWFSRVDPTGYGCGTKLPHNLVSMLGVMDGHQSDLRTGLTWQMVEIHEPVRLLVIVEVPPDDLERLVAASPGLDRLVRNRWIRVAALDPDSPTVRELRPAGFSPVAPTPLPSARTSAEWYRGHRDHLPCARIGAPAPAEVHA